MAKLIVLYKTPTDSAMFDTYYRDIHIPIAKKIPGLRNYEISRGPVAGAAADSGVHLVATLGFDSMDAIQSGLASAEGQAAVSDVQKFATGGVDLLMFESAEA
jgi:uncharacterized protein (TIGR02118 family)